MNLPQVIVLAGGLGTRLRPLTDCIPKPIVEVDGKPFLYYLLQYLKSQQFAKVILSLGYLADQITNYCRKHQNFGLDIIYSMENQPVGTGGAVRLASRFIDCNDFFLINGDTFLPINYLKMYSCFLKSKKTGMLGLYDNRKRFLAPNNILTIGNQIIGYNKKQDCKMNALDAGVRIFSSDILHFFSKNKAFSFEDVIYPKLIRGKSFGCYLIKKPFYDIGTPERMKVFEGYLKRKSRA